MEAPAPFKESEMFVELEMTRGVEMFNVYGIQRIAPTKDGCRITLFGNLNPVESKEPYEDAIKKLRERAARVKS